ncbi:hypothetical protein L210DRAFT_3500700 [Boletus edulis BED1]|uniref:Uncharacterized protein n=1 Tax=Boletus edulis BED1 TaxID=1328754 RepID=A0AAD4GKG6_BOLED|nr:hypothetical protein L210DRAFT_3500700 [Boletus edulis BED1]
MSMYTLTQMKSLKKELAKFIVDEAQSLNKNEQEYVQLVKSAIAYVSDGMQDTEPSKFVFPIAPQGVQVVPQWLQGWKDGQKEKEQEQVYDPIANQRMSGRGSIEPQGGQWHLKDIKKLLPQEENVLEAVDLLAEYPSVYLAAARIHTALEIIPQIVQLKEAWQVWMWNNLAHEVHYRSGTTSDTLCFDKVRANNPLVTGPSYLDVHTALPKLEEDDFWWKALPPYVTLRVSEQHNDSHTQEENCDSKELTIRTCRKSQNQETLLEECSQEAAHAFDGRNDNMPTCKREALKGEGERKCPRKKMKMEVMINSSELRNRGKAQAGPSTSAGVKGKAKEDVPVTPKGQDAPEISWIAVHMAYCRVINLPE